MSGETGSLCRRRKYTLLKLLFLADDPGAFQSQEKASRQEIEQLTGAIRSRLETEPEPHTDKESTK